MLRNGYSRGRRWNGVTQGGVWTTTAAPTSASDLNLGTNQTRRCVIPVAYLTAGKAIRVTFQAASASSGMIISSVYAGESAGSPIYDFAATPIAGTFDGAAGVTLAIGATARTDPFTMPITGLVPIVISAYFTNPARARVLSGVTGWENWARATNTAGNIALGSSPNSTSLNSSYGISLVEVLV